MTTTLNTARQISLALAISSFGFIPASYAAPSIEDTKSWLQANLQNHGSTDEVRIHFDNECIIIYGGLFSRTRIDFSKVLVHGITLSRVGDSTNAFKISIAHDSSRPAIFLKTDRMKGGWTEWIPTNSVTIWISESSPVRPDRFLNAFLSLARACGATEINQDTF